MQGRSALCLGGGVEAALAEVALELCPGDVCASRGVVLLLDGGKRRTRPDALLNDTLAICECVLGGAEIEFRVGNLRLNADAVLPHGLTFGIRKRLREHREAVLGGCRNALNAKAAALVAVRALKLESLILGPRCSVARIERLGAPFARRGGGGTQLLDVDCLSCRNVRTPAIENCLVAPRRLLSALDSPLGAVKIVREGRLVF